MVFEQIVSPERLERTPARLFVVGFVWTILAAAISLYLFFPYASMLTVTFIVMLTLPFVYRVLGDEEIHYDEGWTEKNLFSAHLHTFACFLWLFFGILLGYVGWYLFAPPPLVSSLFQAQTASILDVNGPAGYLVSSGTFWIIFWHNTRILLVSIFLAFFLGAGPIFILTWNASVIATAIGHLFRDEWGVVLLSAGDLRSGEIAQAIMYPFFRYLAHGIPEILGYIAAGLAGGIISVAVIRHHFSREHFHRAIGDACALVVFSLFLLFAAALIEVRVLASV